LTSSFIIQPRPEIADPEKFVFSISLENLVKAGTPETDPNWFLANTYPSEEVREFVSELAFLVKRQRSRTIIMRGGYGTCKSHLLALGYHCFANPRQMKKWLSKWADKFPSLKDIEPPEIKFRPIVFSTKAQGAKYRYLWDAIFSEGVPRTEGNEALKLFKKGTTEGRSPDKRTIAGAFNLVSQSSYLTVLVDELDAWVGELQLARKANIYFVEKLCEVFLQGMVEGVLVLSIRGIDPELNEAIERAGPKTFSPGGSPDRPTIIKYRLFEEPTKPQSQRIESLAKRYVEASKEVVQRFKTDESLKHMIFDPLDYRRFEERMASLYPLNPRFIETLLRKYDALSEQSKEGIRGPMYMLIDIVNQTEDKDMLLAGDASYKTIFERLRNERIKGKIEEDFERFTQMEGVNREDIERLLNVIYLCSLPEDAKAVGAGALDLILGVSRPGMRTYDIVNNARRLEGDSLYIYPEKGRLVVKDERKVSVEIQDVARKIRDDSDRVFRRLGTFVKETFVRSVADSDGVVVLEDPDAIAIPLKGKRLRVFHSFKREAEDEKLHSRIWPWFEKVDSSYRNLAVAIVPSRGVDLTTDPDFLWNLKSLIAAEEVVLQYKRLVRDADKQTAQEYEDRAGKADGIANTSARRIMEHIKEQQWNMMTFAYDEKGKTLRPYLEPFSETLTYDRVRLFLKKKYIQNLQPVKDEIKGLIEKAGTSALADTDVLGHFYMNVGCPIIVDESVIVEALREIPMEDKTVTMKIEDKPIEAGKKAPSFSIGSAVLTKGPMIKVPTPRIEKKVREEQIQIQLEPVTFEGKPFEVIPQLEALISQKLTVRPTSVTVVVDYGKDIPLTLLSESGLPQVAVKNAKLTIEVTVPETIDPNIVMKIINNLTALRELKVKAQDQSLKVQVNVERK